MPAASQLEQVTDAVRASLEEISAGATYHYTPKVFRRSWFGDERLQEALGKVLYYLVPDVVAFDEETYRRTRGVVELDVVCCHYFERAAQENDERWKIQHNMAQDVVGNLRAAAQGADTTLGGLCEHLGFDMLDLGAEETFVDRWVLAFLRLRVSYVFTDGEL